MTIRMMKNTERDVITNLAMESKAYWGYSPDFMEACREELTITDSKFNDPDFHFYVLESESKLAGFYALQHLNAEKYELDALFIQPTQIGKGFGRQLLTHAISKVAELGAKTLVILADPHAEAFYASLGAKVLGKKQSGSIPNRYLPLMEIDICKQPILCRNT